MKVTVHIEREVSDPVYLRQKTEVVADCADMEFTPSLTASFLRALADEIDPRKTH